MEETLKILMPVVAAHVVVLVVILLFIRKMLLGDTVRAVERIRQVEAEVRRKEEGIRRQIEDHEKELAKKRAEGEARLKEEREKSEREVGQVREHTLAEARKEADRILDNARKDEVRIREQIEQEMEEKAVYYGGEVFKLVFSEKVTGDLNASFIDELLDALSEVDAGSITVDSSDAHFASSHPIAPEQKTRIQALLAEKFGADVKVEEEIREELLAGLVFKLGSLEIDGSLLNRYREAAAEVKKTAHA